MCKMKLKKEFVSFLLLTISCTLIRSSGFELRKTKNDQDRVNKSDFDNLENSNNNSVVQNELNVLQNPEEVSIQNIQTEEPCLGMMRFSYKCLHNVLQVLLLPIFVDYIVRHNCTSTFPKLILRNFAKSFKNIWQLI